MERPAAEACARAAQAGGSRASTQRWLARLETLEVGKTDFDAAKIEIPTVANILDYYAGFTDKLTGDTLPARRAFCG